MKLSIITFLLVTCAIIDVRYCKLQRVPIKSHKVLTDVKTDEMRSMYDNNMSTRGSFYNATPTTAEVEFDLEANYVIEKIEVTLKTATPEISFIVGNFISGEGGLPYNCFVGTKSTDDYECIPKCRGSDPSRNGIMARKIMMSFHVSNKWGSIYEIRVYTRLKNQDFSSISDYRLVEPNSCDTKSWLINNLEASNSTQQIAHKSGTKIFFEKSYIVTTVDVKFVENNPKTLKFQLSNGDKRHVEIELDLAKCTFDTSKFTCQLKESIFPTRIVTIISSGVSRISFNGKTVFYPTLSIRASTNKKEDLKLTCQVNPCDLSVHRSCSKDFVKPGIEFPCNNKRLIRMPSGGKDIDTYVIVNQGEVEKVWSDTKFAVETSLENKMVVSMPRSYQYFGQYKCSCFVGDELGTEIQSTDTTLTEADFMQNNELIFKINTQFKILDSDKTQKDAKDNLIAIHEKYLLNTFITMRTISLSLVSGINVNITYPTTVDAVESFSHEESTPVSLKAFESNPQSWYVRVHRYLLDEISPEFIHNKDVVINYNSKMYNMSQQISIRLLRISDNANTKPELVQDITNKLISIRALYSGIGNQVVSVTEENCLKIFTEKLGSVSRNNCTSFNAQASCSKPGDVPFLSIKQERNIASAYKYSFLNTETNNTSYVYINSSQHPDVKDVRTKMSYIDFNYDSINPDISIIQVELEIISKTISSFIPCGKVLLKTIESGKTIKELVLQQPKYKFSVSSAAKSVNVTIKLEINDKEVYSEDLEIENPKNFEIRNLVIKGDPNLQAVWKGINKMAYSLLEGYEVKIVTTTLPCNISYDQKIMINKTETVGGRNTYIAPIGYVNDKQSSFYIVSVQPVFHNDKKGILSDVKQKFINTKRTKVVISKDVLSKQRSVSIIPSQLDFPCPLKSVNFELRGIYVNNVIKSTKMIDDKNYIIDKLMPGRKYQLTAQAVYKGGLEDVVSKTYTFETADQISIAQDIHVAQINEKINITCEAEIGPADEFQKSIRWRRDGNAPLPDGSYYQSFNNKAFLIIEKVQASHTYKYGCYVLPPASVGTAKINIYVNDLEIEPVNTKINFSLPPAQMKPIRVRCFAYIIGNLTWYDPDNSEISKENENYKIESNIVQGMGRETFLFIKNPSLKTSGEYNCYKSYDKIKVSKKFLLYGEEKLGFKLLPNSSMLIGEKSRIRCMGQVAVKSQKVVWDIKSLTVGTKDLIKVITPDPADPYTQDLEIINDLTIHSVSCKILPPVNETSIELKKSYPIKLAAKIEVDGPINVIVGKSINLTCTGYPIKPSMILQWVFYNQKTTNDTGVVVLSSKNQSTPKSYEPIKLTLALKNVKEQEAGRYECKFKTELQAEKFVSKSLSLSVDSNQNSLLNIGRSVGNPKRGGNGAHSVFVNTKFSISVYALFLASLVFFRI